MLGTLAPGIVQPVGPVFMGASGVGYMPGGVAAAGSEIVSPVYRIASGVGQISQTSTIRAASAGTSYGTIATIDNGYGVAVPTDAQSAIDAQGSSLFGNFSPTFLLGLALIGWLLVRK